MTKEETGKLFRMLGGLYPHLKKENTEDMEAAFWLVLRHYDYKDVRDAVLLRAEHARSYPLASDIVELLPKEKRRLDHWTRDAARKLFECADDKCAECPDNQTCKLKAS